MNKLKIVSNPKSTGSSSKWRVLSGVAVTVIVASAGLFFVAQSEAATPCRNAPVERYGSQGNCVKIIQRLIGPIGIVGQTSKGYGKFGPATKRAVVAYQVRQRIIPNANSSEAGHVGKRTWALLCANLSYTRNNAQIAREMGCLTGVARNGTTYYR